MLNAFENVKLITTRSTGFDHIDLEECKKRGVAVSNVPGYGDSTVAEFTFGLMLALTRKIYDCVRVTKTGSDFSELDLRGRDLRGKILGVLGTGRIGREVIKIAKGFGMEVVAFDIKPDKEFAKEVGFKYLDFDNVLRKSDIVSLHCFYCEDTHHVMNAEKFGLMKKGAYLINAARGGLVDTDALTEFLKSGHLGGCALDVMEEIEDENDSLGGARGEEFESMRKHKELVGMPNVLVTPHNAFNSEEAVRRILDINLDSIEGFLKGKGVNLVG